MGSTMAPARNSVNDLYSSPSPNKLENRVIGPGLYPTVFPPLKTLSEEARGLISLLGRAALEGGVSPSPFPPVTILLGWTKTLKSFSFFSFFSIFNQTK